MNWNLTPLFKTQEDFKAAYELLINQERELGFYE